jgi:hypothetical protein
VRRKSKDKTQLEADSVGYMPERFITGYFELVKLGLKIEPSAQIFDSESTQPKKKYYQHDGGLKDEAALRFKAWVDRQLRAIGRDIQAYLNARDSKGPSPIGMSHKERKEIAKQLEEEIELTCPDCLRYASWQWAFCAWCGKKLNHEPAAKRIANGRYRKQAGGSSEPEAAADNQQQPSGGTGLHPVGENGDEAGRDDETEASADSRSEQQSIG